ncbi:MAG TPA: rhomboid family intramembrane serine protease [Burkholderiaceae bacterium]|jgi:membrane associated rhomboid family serine protease|nr:rhomboid family intramembrane serine protease [Burkholderiaceae bacterium]
MPHIPPYTKGLMLACVALSCIAWLVPGLFGVLALWPLASGHFLPWQVLSYAFLHGDVFHLFFNMFGLWMFGSEIEQLWGQKRYARFLLASVLTAALVQLGFTALMGTFYPTVGISGGLFGLLLAFGMMFPNRIIMPLFPPIPMKAKVFVAVFGALELLLGVGGRDGIAHFAHLGGMLGGWLMIRFWRGQAPFGRRR